MPGLKRLESFLTPKWTIGYTNTHFCKFKCCFSKLPDYRESETLPLFLR